MNGRIQYSITNDIGFGWVKFNLDKFKLINNDINEITITLKKMNHQTLNLKLNSIYWKMGQVNSIPSLVGFLHETSQENLFEWEVYII